MISQAAACSSTAARNPVVMTGSGDYVEIQATAEGRPYTSGELQELLALAAVGIRVLGEEQRTVLPAKFLARGK